MRALVVVCAVVLAASAIARAEGDAARGEKLFGECAPCHSLEKNKETVGPSLYGVFGRKAASSTDFRYSPALKRSGVAWDEQTMDKYLADPQRFVPGNRMPFGGIVDAGARADLIAYLAKTFK
jgi:cytochrome c